jgi:hypothetical protein
MNRRSFFQRTAGALVVAPFVANKEQSEKFFKLSVPVVGPFPDEGGLQVAVGLLDIQGHVVTSLGTQHARFGNVGQGGWENIETVTFPPVTQAVHLGGLVLASLDGISLINLNLTQDRLLTLGDTVAFQPGHIRFDLTFD